jgi:antirestriction protein ArdC
MNGGKRKLTAWNILVKKVFAEGKSKNKNYSFKQALSDASKRKGEMGSTNHSNSNTGKTKKHRKNKRGTKKNRKNK